MTDLDLYKIMELQVTRLIRMYGKLMLTIMIIHNIKETT